MAAWQVFPSTAITANSVNELRALCAGGSGRNKNLFVEILADRQQLSQLRHDNVMERERQAVRMEEGAQLIREKALLQVKVG